MSGGPGGEQACADAIAVISSVVSRPQALPTLEEVAAAATALSTCFELGEGATNVTDEQVNALVYVAKQSAHAPTVFKLVEAMQFLEKSNPGRLHRHMLQAMDRKLSRGLKTALDDVVNMRSTIDIVTFLRNRSHSTFVFNGDVDGVDDGGVLFVTAFGMWCNDRHLDFASIISLDVAGCVVSIMTDASVPVRVELRSLIDAQLFHSQVSQKVHDRKSIAGFILSGIVPENTMHRKKARQKV